MHHENKALRARANALEEERGSLMKQVAQLQDGVRTARWDLVSIAVEAGPSGWMGGGGRGQAGEVWASKSMLTTRVITKESAALVLTMPLCLQGCAVGAATTRGVCGGSAEGRDLGGTVC